MMRNFGMRTNQLAGPSPSDLATRSLGIRGKERPSTNSPPLFIPRSILIPYEPPVRRGEIAQALADIACLLAGAALISVTGVGLGIAVFILFML